MKVYQQECRKINEDTVNLVSRLGDGLKLVALPKITIKDYEGYGYPNCSVLCEHNCNKNEKDNICDKDEKRCYLAR